MRINTRTAPTNRTVARLEAQGYQAAIVERRQGKISIDLYGCIDVLGVHRVRRLDFVFVQVTSNNGGHVADRVRKVVASPKAKVLLRAGARVEVWGWTHERAHPRIVRLRIRSPNPEAKP